MKSKEQIEARLKVLYLVPNPAYVDLYIIRKELEWVLNEKD